MRSRRPLIAGAILVVGALGVGAAVGVLAGAESPEAGGVALASSARSTSVGAVQVQLLQPREGEAASYAADGVDIVTLELGWDEYQPSPGETDRKYVAKRLAEAEAYADAGLELVLDLGLQYPPSWARDLPGETRFVNQHGDQWHGGTGNDPLDGVWNPAVRTAQGDYVARVAQDFATVVDRVRVGGLLSGEIRLPPANAAGHVDSLWAFGAGALAASPDPTWRPDEGTTEQAGEWLDFYLSSVSGYAVWLTQTVDAAFPAASIDVLLPGWGVRPGDVRRMAEARLSPSAVATTGDDLAGGIDWPRQLRALDALDLDLTAVSTWVDAPSYGTRPGDLAPVEYLATITGPLGMPLSGENTGGGGQAALARVREQVDRLDLRRITWMPTGTGDDITPEDLGEAFPH